MKQYLLKDVMTIAGLIIAFLIAAIGVYEAQEGSEAWIVYILLSQLITGISIKRASGLNYEGGQQVK